jgi:hypothetical protein
MANATHYPHPWIRPSPEYLKTLPTLRVLTPETDCELVRSYCRAQGCDFQLELKLEMETTRYWVITRCIGEPLAGWKEGKIVAENVQTVSELLPYGSADLKRLQRLDYIAMLGAELDRILGSPWSWETDDRIREVRMEMYKVMGGPKFKFKEHQDGTIVVESKAPGGDDVEPGRRC